MRIRTIKPEFYMNDELAALPATTRILFTGLWGLADCEGRLEDKPKRIKLQVLPYDDVDVDAALQDLHDTGFIFRYEIDGQSLIEVINFKKHQRLSGSEAKFSSVLPAKTTTSKAKAPRKHFGKRELKSKSTEENCDSNADFQGSTQEALWHAGKEGKGKEGNFNARADSAKPEPDSTFSQTTSPPAPSEPVKPQTFAENSTSTESPDAPNGDASMPKNSGKSSSIPCRRSPKNRSKSDLETSWSMRLLQPPAETPSPQQGPRSNSLAWLLPKFAKCAPI